MSTKFVDWSHIEVARARTPPVELYRIGYRKSMELAMYRMYERCFSALLQHLNGRGGLTEKYPGQGSVRLDQSWAMAMDVRLWFGR